MRAEGDRIKLALKEQGQYEEPANILEDQYDKDLLFTDWGGTESEINVTTSRDEI